MSSMAGMPSAMIGAVHGIGAGERTFPPQAGMTFIAWVCVERFSSPYDDPHPIRLLTICYKTRQLDGSFRDITCLNIRISGMDRSLVVSKRGKRSGKRRSLPFVLLFLNWPQCGFTLLGDGSRSTSLRFFFTATPFSLLKGMP